MFCHWNKGTRHKAKDFEVWPTWESKIYCVVVVAVSRVLICDRRPWCLIENIFKCVISVLSVFKLLLCVICLPGWCKQTVNKCMVWHYNQVCLWHSLLFKVDQCIFMGAYSTTTYSSCTNNSYILAFVLSSWCWLLCNFLKAHAATDTWFLEQ